MIDGFWTVQFSAPQQNDFGQGVVVFQNGKVYGGDGANTYTGSYKLSGDDVTFTLRIDPYGTPQGTNIFGTFGSFDLSLSGKAGADAFTVTGTSPQPIQVRAQKVQDL